MVNSSGSVWCSTDVQASKTNYCDQFWALWGHRRNYEGMTVYSQLSNLIDNKDLDDNYTTIIILTTSIKVSLSTTDMASPYRMPLSGSG